MNSYKNAHKAVDTAVTDNGVIVGNDVSGALFLHSDDIEHMLELLSEHDGDEYGYLVAELREQLRKQQ